MSQLTLPKTICQITRTLLCSNKDLLGPHIRQGKTLTHLSTFFIHTSLKRLSLQQQHHCNYIQVYIFHGVCHNNVHIQTCKSPLKQNFLATSFLFRVPDLLLNKPIKRTLKLLNKTFHCPEVTKLNETRSYTCSLWYHMHYLSKFNC